jgi:uncharacterized membrane protein
MSNATLPKSDAPRSEQAKAAGMTRARFLTKAPVLTVVINGQTFQATAREFSSGKVGYYINGKVNVIVDGVPVQLQVGNNNVASKSDEWPAA